MFNFLFGKDTEIYLLNQQNFSSNYQLTTKSCFVMGKNNPPVHILSTAMVDLKQIVDKKKIITRISVTDVTGEADHNNFKESIREMQLFTEINPVIEVERGETGKVKRISNMSEIRGEWEKWKDRQLPSAVPDERKQQKVIKNYETGLKLLEYNFDKNLQYVLLLPECYQFTNYHNPQDLGTTKTYSSRLIEKLDIFYRLRKRSFSEENPLVKLILDSQSDIEEKEEQLISFYEKYLPGFSHKDYLFDIKAEYTFNKNTSEIMNGKLSFIEKLHSDFFYAIELDLAKQKTTINEEQETTIPPLSQPQRQPKKKWSILLDDDDSFVIG
ncbi:MAG: hypothetical protein LBJ72_12655 [Dysgonamonadaceae bacterium]|jgi:hypothetical protein|nr:hypothetical protein [Dysgonamonadaceae bacterium]